MKILPGLFLSFFLAVNTAALDLYDLSFTIKGLNPLAFAFPS